jgi:hypothetical protein
MEKEGRQVPERDMNESAKVIKECIICVKYEFFGEKRQKNQSNTSDSDNK